MTSTVSQLLGRGQSLPLTNDSEVTLRYGMKELAKIEDRYGSIDAMLKELDKGAEGKVMTTVIELLWFGQHGWVGDREEFVDHLDPRQIEEYTRTITAALNDAFPPKKAQEKDEPAQIESLSPSPGQVSTGSAQSSSDAAMATSGT